MYHKAVFLYFCFMSNSNPIGLFDSGIGGTSIWKEVHALLPNENTIYLADSINAPYGKKTKDEIVSLCFKNVDFLLDNNCKLIVVACNTATTNAIKEMRAKYSVPIIGIEPAIKPAANLSETKTIGILATKGTLNSELFNQQLQNYSNVTFLEQVGYGLVELIEAGKIATEEMRNLLKLYLRPMIDAGMDYLVLGCSHYPYLITEIKKIVPNTVQIIDSGQAVARQTKAVLAQHNLLNTSNEKGKAVFYSNSDAQVLKNILGFESGVFQKDF